MVKNITFYSLGLGCHSSMRTYWHVCLPGCRFINVKDAHGSFCLLVCMYVYYCLIIYFILHLSNIGGVDSRGIKNSLYVGECQFHAWYSKLAMLKKIINNKKKPPARINFSEKKDDKLMFFFRSPKVNKKNKITY